MDIFCYWIGSDMCWYNMYVKHLPEISVHDNNFVIVCTYLQGVLVAVNQYAAHKQGNQVRNSMEVYNTNIKKKNNIELNQDMAQNDDSKDRLVKKFDITENNKINMQIPMDDEFIIGTLNQEENGEKIDNNDEIEREIKPSFKTPKPPPRRIRGANKKKSIEVTNIDLDQYQE